MNFSNIRRLSTLTTSNNGINVSILGASGRLGRLVALILKQSPRITELRLYDIPGSEPIGSDLWHIDTKCKIYATQDNKNLETLLNGSDIVLITAGKPRNLNLSLGEMLRFNSKIVIELTHRIATFCPKAIIGVITDPLHCIMPVVGMTLKHYKVFNPATLFGISSINNTRAATIIAEAIQIDPSAIKVPVIGGTFGDTVVPLFSKIIPKLHIQFSQDMLVYLTERIRKAPLNIVEANNGQMTGCISSAYAVSGFVHTIAGALLGEITPVIYTMSYQEDSENFLPYLVTPVKVSTKGIEKNYSIPTDLTNYEFEQLERAKQRLAIQENFGIDLAAKLINEYDRKKITKHYLSASKPSEFIQLEDKNLFMTKNSDKNKSNREKEILNKEESKDTKEIDPIFENETSDPLTGHLFYKIVPKRVNNIRVIQNMMIKKVMLKSEIINE